MSPRIPRQPSHRMRASRVGRTLTLSPRSEALLTMLSARANMARGRIVDLALANIGLCDACKGCGAVAGPLGPDTVECAACAGEGIVPGLTS